jgi:hypothetical protein
MPPLKTQARKFRGLAGNDNFVPIRPRRQHLSTFQQQRGSGRDSLIGHRNSLAFSCSRMIEGTPR